MPDYLPFCFAQYPGPDLSDRLPVRQGDISLQDGYYLEPVAVRLNYPISVTFDDMGGVYVGEAGFSYGPAKADGMGRIIKILGNGRVHEIARGFRGPMTGLKFHRGYFYVAEGSYPGRILRVDMNGRREILVDGLRSGGDHYTSDIVFSPDGTMFFGVGTSTNSSVVGLDNFSLGWLPDMPKFHDVPFTDIRLAGVNYECPDPFALANGQVKLVKTGPYKPFAMACAPGEIIPGNPICNGAIYRCDSDGRGLQVYAHGLRNPFGLAFGPDGQLYCIDQGYDGRGSRPVANAPDPMWLITPGGWYGWPDYVAGEPITDPKFTSAGKPKMEFVLADHPELAGMPIIKFTPHSAAMKFDFSKNPQFGFVNEAFIAQFGSEAPATGTPTGKPGFRIVRANARTGRVDDFLIINRPDTDGTGPARPVDAKFSPDGRSLYIVDFGVITGNASGAIPWANSGALWRVSPKNYYRY